MANLTIAELKAQLAAVQAELKAAKAAQPAVQPSFTVDGDFITVTTGISQPKRMKLATARVVRDVLVNANIG